VDALAHRGPQRGAELMSRGGGARSRQRAEAQHRSALELEWEDKLRDDASFAPLVVAKGALSEPFHRWMAYRQGFSPELVRRFLAHGKLPDGVILDPFSGSGTVATEAARQGRAALGIDAVGSLAFMARARALEPAPDIDVTADATPATFFAAATETSHRAAALLTASALVDGEGHGRKNPRPAREILVETLSMMREDAQRPDRPARAAFLQGDARRLPLGDGSVAGILTSPPYLSRYDYARVNDAAERIWRGRGRRAGRKRQLRASRAAIGGSPTADLHPAIKEAAERLAHEGRQKEAEAALVYIADMTEVVRECARVLAPGAPLWMVIAGSEFKKVYIPCDLICAAVSADAGLRVESVAVARLLKKTGRKLGDLSDVAPREVVMMARRS